MQYTMATNELIISNLKVLLREAQAAIKDDRKNIFRARAYRTAIRAIENCNHQVTSGEDVKKLNGIGPKTAAKIQEILDTGKLHQVDDLGENKLEKSRVITAFTNVWGIGAVRANELWDAGARTIDDLCKKKYQDYLTDNQKVGVKYYHDLLKRVPRKDVDEISKTISATLRDIQNEYGWKIKMRVCGSYRRRCETCGDMDVLLCSKHAEKVMRELVRRLADLRILIETLGLGSTKYLGITKTGDGVAFRIDMECIKPHEWPFALLYFTGSSSFNERQRLIAKKMGYSLSEHGLKNVKTGKFVEGIRNELDIFEFLDMEYLSPWERK